MRLGIRAGGARRAEGGIAAWRASIMFARTRMRPVLQLINAGAEEVTLSSSLSGGEGTAC